MHEHKWKWNWIKDRFECSCGEQITLVALNQYINTRRVRNIEVTIKQELLNLIAERIENAAKTL